MPTTIQMANQKRFARMPAALVFLCLSLGAASIRAQQTPVTTQVEITKRTGGNQPAGAANDLSNVAIWLDPLDHAAENTDAPNGGHSPQMVQRNKTFEPHVLIVETGTSVVFPNKDPFLHNVFSLFNGKRFDLGFYEAGSSKSVRFDRPGVSFLFCSIHEEMTAVVVAVNTPYYALSDRSGHATIPNVPDGRYQMHVWYERSLPEDLKNLDRTVEVSSSNRSLDRIRVVENPDFTLAHKNKYGQDYVPPSSLGYTP
jgi:plastocyanin